MTQKLTKQDWLAFALKELARNGHSQLKANRLAVKLGVSRGSFYWHFEDVHDFETALLESWADLTTETVIKELKLRSLPEVRLVTLMKRAMSGHAKLERAIRSWATSDKKVAKAVGLVDKRRIEYIEEIFEIMRVSKANRRARALILYWASIGRMMISDQEGEHLSDAELEHIANLLTS